MKVLKTDKATITLDYASPDLVVTVEDDGVGPSEAAIAQATGNGVTGMRERAAAAGGELSLGARGDGASGFRVRARLPIEGTA